MKTAFQKKEKVRLRKLKTITKASQIYWILRIQVG